MWLGVTRFRTAVAEVELPEVPVLFDAVRAGVFAFHTVDIVTTDLKITRKRYFFEDVPWVSDEGLKERASHWMKARLRNGWRWRESLSRDVT
jgi:hypothetical protein